MSVDRVIGSARFVDWTLRHGRLLWLVAILLAIPATVRTASLYLHLESSLEALLPRDAPSVVALDELRARIGDTQYVGVVVDAGDPAAVPSAERFVDDLAARARAYPRNLVSAVRTGNDVERDFLERNAPLYMDVDDLRTVRERLEVRRDYEVAAQAGQLLDDEGPPTADFDDLRRKYESRLGESGSGRSGARYSDAKSHMTVLLLECGASGGGPDGAKQLLARLTADIEDLGLDRYAPGMRVGFAGGGTIAVEELSALVSDLSLSSVVVVIAVIGAIIAFYRWGRSVLVVLPPLLVATVYSFGVASLLGVTSLNSNTAFLGSIIVGNGINFGLVLLARYVEERTAGSPVRASLERAVSGARAGTLAAAFAAGVAYASLALTQFRGFRQFGLIGGFGMVFAWAAAFLLMPSLIAALDRDDASRPRPRREDTRLSYWVTRMVSASPRLVLVASAFVTVVAAAEIARFRATDLETDFSRLRRRDTWAHGEGYWGDRMNAVIGAYLTPLAFVADTPADAHSLAERLRSEQTRAPFTGRIDAIRTIDDVLPLRQEEKLAEVRAIRKVLTPRVRRSLDDAQRDYVRRFVDTELRPFGLEDLPHGLTLGLRERDGSAGRVVLVFPTTTASWWDGTAMRAFVSGLRRVAAESVSTGNPPRLAGSFPLSSDIVAAIERDGPLASAIAFGAVVAVLVVLLRRWRPILYVTCALAVGVSWLAGTSQLFHVRINFANFIAFPITFGIGVDYAVNVVSRWERDGSGDILAAVRSTGAAVALCSLTTIIGYSSLLMAQNQALFLFGVLAVLGEVCCLTVALVTLPALIVVVRARSSQRLSTARPVLGPRGA